MYQPAICRTLAFQVALEEVADGFSIRTYGKYGWLPNNGNRKAIGTGAIQGVKALNGEGRAILLIGRGLGMIIDVLLRQEGLSVGHPQVGRARVKDHLSNDLRVIYIASPIDIIDL